MNTFLKRFCCILTFIFFLSLHCNLYADNHKVPVVGKPCPDFTLNNLINSNKASISLKDYKGKWLMIDIWESTCAVCIHKFPLVSRLQQQFPDQLSVLLVGINDAQYNKNIKDLYRKLESKLHFQLLSAFDTVIWKQWEIYSVPYIVLVNPQGLVYAITNGLDMDSFKIQQMIAGGSPQFMTKDRKIKFDYKKPLLIDNNGGLDTSYLYRSVLSRYTDEDYYTPLNIYDYSNKNKTGFQITCAKLYRLYYYAYVGQWLWGVEKDSLFDTVSTELELDIKDSSLFRKDYESLKNRFNYSLFLPPGKDNTNRIMQALQRELKNCFGYDASLEDREVPCWTLSVRKDTVVSLRAKNEMSEQMCSPVELHFKNSSVQLVLEGIANFFQDQTPFIDETGIDYPIDIQIDALMTDMAEIQRELRRNGLVLSKKKRPMKVIVIRDPSDQ